jgi:hypothetical protein
LESDPFYKLEYTAADDGSGRRLPIQACIFVCGSYELN